MHRSILAIAASTALIFSGTSYAMQRGHGGGKPTTTHGQSGSTHGQSGATTHGQSGSHGPATKPSGSGATHASGAGSTHASGGGKTATTTTTSTSTSPTTTTSSTSTTTTFTPVQQKLQRNTNLADKLSSRLPAGTDLMKAAQGFTNLGQFVAAVNVSNNLGLTFTDLKTRMLDQGMSLGQAIQDVKGTTNVETEVSKAETEANAMIKASETSTTETKTKKTSKGKTKTHSGTGDK